MYIVAAQGRAFSPLLWPGGRRSSGSPQGLESLRFPPSRPQATVITEPHVRWPATIYFLDIFPEHFEENIHKTFVEHFLKCKFIIDTMLT